MKKEDTEIYAGYKAWRDWFELCAVKKCRNEEQRSLARQISSALSRELSRYGVKPSDYEGEDLSDLFDIHFVLNGSKDGRKPLKQYYLARVNKENEDELKKLVCGTFFSPRCGRVKDIVRHDIIPLIMGWEVHKIDGKIVVVKPPETLPDEQAIEIPAPPTPPPSPPPEVWTRHIAGIFEAIGGKGSIDAPLLVYSIANGIRPYNAVVWKHLGVRSVMANRRFHQALDAMAKYMKKHKLTFEDSDFVAALITASENRLGENIIKELENSK